MAMFNYESEDIANICQGSHSSDTLYVAECKKTIIDGVKGSYPQLCGYEKEWLDYGKTHYEGGTPSNLEYQSVTVNPVASVENAIPFRYKSAILKGDSQRVFSPTKNLFDGELEQGTISSSNGNNSDLSTAIRSKNFVEIGVNTAFTLSRKKGTASLGFRCYDKNKNFLGTIFTTINAGTLKVTYTTDSNTVYIRFIDNTNDLTNKYQIEIGSTATDYEEPNYELKSVKMPALTTSNEDGTKTNILTANEDVTLRGIGDVKDTLDLLTGEVTQRIDEVVLNGSGAYNIGASSNDNYLEFIYSVKTNSKRASVLCDKVFTPSGGHQNNIEYIRATESGIIGYILKSRLSTPDIKGLKEWLSLNNVTVQYQLKTESIKTVGLSTLIKPYEGVNHYQTSSDTIPPEAVLSVPVVSTGAQTLNEILTAE